MMRKIETIIVAVVLLAGCSKSGTETKPTANLDPVAATLIFPAQNEVCTTGTEISETQNSVTFTWKPALNASSYDLLITNLLSDVTTTQNVKDNKATVTLTRGASYAWSLISKSLVSSATAQSETWKFYNAGRGVTSYAPFPADLIAPSNGSTVSSTDVTLSWAGSSTANGNILNYDVYWGTTTSPPLYKTDVTESKLIVPVESKTTYYWKIATRSAEGNVSYSKTNQYSSN